MLTDTEALHAIHALLDGSTWDAETLDEIAALLRRAGLEVREPLTEYERRAVAYAKKN